MPTVVQFRRGTTAQNNSHVGAAGEISIDTTLNSIRVHNGVDSGGFTTVMETAKQTVTNKTFNDTIGLNIIDSDGINKISFGDDKSDIFMNDSNLFVRNNADGYMYFGVKTGQHFEFRDQDNDNLVARFSHDSGVQLWHRATQKLGTIDSADSASNGGVIIYGDLLPDVDSARSLGSPNKKWKDLYLSGSTLHLGTLKLKDASGTLNVEDSSGSVLKFGLGANTTDDLSEGSNNLYYTTARHDSDFLNSLNGDITIGGTAVINGDLTVNGTTTTVNSTTLSINDLNIVLADSAQDSSQSDGAGITVNGSGAKITYNNENGTWNFNRPFGTTTNVISNYTTDNLTEGANLYYTRTRFDDALGDATSTATIRSYFSASGDLTYDSNTGEFSFDVENVYTQANFDSDFNTSLDDAAIDGVGLTYNSSTNKLSIDSAELGSFKSPIRSYFSAAGDLTYDSNTGEFSFDVENVYTQANFDSDFNTSLDDAALGGTGLTYNSSTNTLSITNTGVAAATYGSSTLIPVLTINAQGQIDSAGTVSVAGVSTLDFDSATGQISIGTADGGTFAQVITLDPYTTSTLTEGTNLYYTRARFDSALGDATSIASVRSYFSAAGDLSYDSNTGVFTFDVENVYTKTNFDSDLELALSTDAVTTSDLTEGTNLYYTTARADSDFDIRLATKTTANLTEDTNLYYTTARADSDFDVRLATKSTDNLTEGANLYYTTARADSAFDDRLAIKSTSDLSEGTNLYYTTARADSDAKNAISVTDAGGDGSLTYSNTTGVITYTGPSAGEVRAHFSGGTGVTITDGEVAIGQPVDSSNSPTFNAVTNTTGTVTTTPTQTLASSDATVIVDTVAHGSDFKSIEYVVHMDDSDNGHSQMSKVLVTYNKSNVFYTEYGMVNSYTGDSDIGTLSADVSGGDIRLKFTRTAGIGTVAVKPVKTIIS